MLDAETPHAPAELRTIRLSKTVEITAERYTTFFPSLICEFKYAKN
jgi:hypothetical protein